VWIGAKRCEQISSPATALADSRTVDLRVLDKHTHTYTHTTLTKYIPAFRQFVAWGLRSGEDPIDAAEMDEVLTDYLHICSSPVAAGES